MARLPRVVVPGQPHHVTQRSVRRTNIFCRHGRSQSVPIVPGEVLTTTQREVLGLCADDQSLH